MAQEIEAKFRVDDFGMTRARLERCDAQRVGQVLESDRILDTPERKLLAEDRALRLRTRAPLDGDRVVPATLTYKGPRAAAVAKIREEIETTVGDVTATAALLERLGLREVIVYEKRRESWKIGACTVCLDELPRLGRFVEVEGPSLEALEATLDLLGLALPGSLRETYVEMVAVRGELSAEGVRSVRFEPDGDAT